MARFSIFCVIFTWLIVEELIPNVNAGYLFRCPSDCSVLPCIKPRELRRQCKGGLVYDVCGCCQRCAKLYGEVCGGYQDIKGSCDSNLYCQKKKGQRSVGRCKYVPRKPKRLIYELRIGNEISQCRPLCTPKFCSKWPDAVCSASSNAVATRTCQAPCQHTVCQACYFESQTDLPCSRCDRDDFACMQRFAKCAKKDYCTRAKYPCNAHAKRKSDGRFVCKIPSCK